MSLIFNSLASIDWQIISTIIGFIVGAVGIIGTAIQTYRERGAKGVIDTLTKELLDTNSNFNAFKRFMSSDVPMDMEQRNQAANPSNDNTWKMSDGNFNRMYDALYARGVEITKSDLREAVDDAERDLQPEYAIVMRTANYDIDSKATHVFVSYGVFELWSDYDSLVEKWRFNNCERMYNVTVHWHLSEAERRKLFLEVGDRPKCIAEFTNLIEQHEISQTERYALTCGSQWWIVERGKIVNQGGGGDVNDRLKEEAENDECISYIKSNGDV